MLHQSRRSFLKTSASAVGSSLIGESAFLRPLFARIPQAFSGRLMPFPLACVATTSNWRWEFRWS